MGCRLRAALAQLLRCLRKLPWRCGLLLLLLMLVRTHRRVLRCSRGRASCRHTLPHAACRSTSPVPPCRRPPRCSPLAPPHGVAPMAVRDLGVGIGEIGSWAGG
ncbi:Os10g0387100 [Oryza sativa Japonica Group]|uniref:Os10g0387100 protein n=1 Tax=Oryza sativa subsp. japonica TaxID=39947 RepID=A0A0P0XUC5_ORYSJ|nr:Os10g0387100 [Oryza sativa Japonica Group]